MLVPDFPNIQFHRAWWIAAPGLLRNEQPGAAHARKKVEVARRSRHSVSEIIENYLVRALDNAALMRLLHDDSGTNAVHLLGLISRAPMLGPVADWACDERQREVVKIAVSLLFDAIARGELTQEEARAARPHGDLTDSQKDILLEGELPAFTLFNPHELWARPAPPHVKLVQD